MVALSPKRRDSAPASWTRPASSLLITASVTRMPLASNCRITSGSCAMSSVSPPANQRGAAYHGYSTTKNGSPAGAGSKRSSAYPTPSARAGDANANASAHASANARLAVPMKREPDTRLYGLLDDGDNERGTADAEHRARRLDLHRAGVLPGQLAGAHHHGALLELCREASLQVLRIEEIGIDCDVAVRADRERCVVAERDAEAAVGAGLEHVVLENVVAELDRGGGAAAHDRHLAGDDLGPADRRAGRRSCRRRGLGRNHHHQHTQHSHLDLP